MIVGRGKEGPQEQGYLLPMSPVTPMPQLTISNISPGWSTTAGSGWVNSAGSMLSQLGNAIGLR